jgi:hypothetical protein
VTCTVGALRAADEYEDFEEERRIA